MKAFMNFVRNGNRNQSVGLITIGLAMLAASNLAEQAIGDWAAREFAQLVVILFGIAVAVILFRH